MTESSRSNGIDVLRGLSVLFVVVHHIHLRFRINGFDQMAEALPESLARVLFWSGYYAVIAFFVISGFLITRLSISRWQSLPAIPAKQFYVLRLARIAPMLLLVLAVLTVLHLAAVGPFVINPERSTLPRALVAALTFHVNWLEGHRGYLPGNWDVMWSLSVEETFYLMFPIVCLLVRNEKWLLVPLTALLIAGPISRSTLAGQEPWDDYAWLSCMDGIAFGCLAALVSVRLRPGIRVLRAALTVGCAMALFVLVFRKQVFDLGLTKLGLNISLLEIGVAAMLVAFGGGVGSSALGRGWGLIRAIGRCSYEIYLTHMFVVLGLMVLFKALYKAAPPSGAVLPSWYFAMLILSIGLGYGLARTFSEPINHLIRVRFLQREPVGVPLPVV